MNSNRYPLYGAALLVGGGLALWAGLSPFFLVFLVLCPVMMFFMMRGGMHGSRTDDEGLGSPHRSEQAPPSPRPSDLDGSHERIDRP